MFFLLPVRIGLQIRRPHSGDSTRYYLSTGFFVGLSGLRIQAEANRHYLYPEILGRPLCFLGWRLPEKRAASPDKPPEDGPPKSDKKQKKQNVIPTSTKLRRAAFLLIEPGLSYLRNLPRIMGGLRFRADGQVGLHDPSLTGRIVGYAQSLNAVLGRRMRLRIVPNFTSTGVSGILDLRFRLHLGLLLFLTLLFAGRVGLRWLVWRLPGVTQRVESLLPRRWHRWHRT